MKFFMNLHCSEGFIRVILASIYHWFPFKIIVRFQLEEQPKDYDSRLKLIELLRNDGELDALRAQREKMSSMFTMPPEFWLDWIK